MTLNRPENDISQTFFRVLSGSGGFLSEADEERRIPVCPVETHTDDNDREEKSHSGDNHGACRPCRLCVQGALAIAIRLSAGRLSNFSSSRAKGISNPKALA